MLFALSKLLDPLVDPAAWALLLGVAALLLRRRPRASAAAAIAGIVVLWAFSTEALARELALAAERPARDTSRPGVVYDAVVVLSGAMSDAGTATAGRLELGDGADRVVRGFELLLAGRARFALLSGGTGNPRPGAPIEADLTVQLLAGWGIDPGRLVAEARSRNTRENAVETARIVRERGWTRLLLVTSAAHMPRALGCFRAVGLAPDALPVDYRAREGGLSATSLLPRSRALVRSAEVLRELAGRVAYRAIGYAR